MNSRRRRAPEVRTRRMTIVDGAGKVRASLGVDADGTVFLSLNDGREAPRVWLAVNRDGPSHFNLYDQTGQIVFKKP